MGHDPAHPDQRSEAADEVLARVRSDGAARSPRTSSSRSVPAISELAYAEAGSCVASLPTSTPKPS